MYGSRGGSRQGDEVSSHKVKCRLATTASQTTKTTLGMNPGACAGVEEAAVSVMVKLVIVVTKSTVTSRLRLYKPLRRIRLRHESRCMCGSRGDSSRHGDDEISSHIVKCR